MEGCMTKKFHQNSVLGYQGYMKKYYAVLNMHKDYQMHFQSNMGVKQECPLSPTLFGICIDKLRR